MYRNIYIYIKYIVYDAAYDYDDVTIVIIHILNLLMPGDNNMRHRQGDVYCSDY